MKKTEKMKFRLLESKPVEDSYKKMAVDEAILRAVSKQRVKPTLRFYRWNKPAVAIGYFQSTEKEVDVEKCKQDNVEIFRRMTGGGAVYKDPGGELNYSVIAPETMGEIPSDIQETYRKINKFIISALEELGIKAKHSGINDITINNQKISGSAQTRKKGTLLQHGTLLLDFNPNKMIKYLKIPIEKSKDKTTSKIEDRVTTLKQIKSNLTMNSLKETLKQNFEEEFNCELVREGLTKWEREKADELHRKKYSTKEWNYMK
ncbi:MAG: lipoate--protein ligase family protein [archaeon]